MILGCSFVRSFVARKLLALLEQLGPAAAAAGSAVIFVFVITTCFVPVHNKISTVAWCILIVLFCWNSHRLLVQANEYAKMKRKAEEKEEEGKKTKLCREWKMRGGKEIREQNNRIMRIKSIAHSFQFCLWKNRMKNFHFLWLNTYFYCVSSSPTHTHTYILHSHTHCSYFSSSLLSRPLFPAGNDVNFPH